MFQNPYASLNPRRTIGQTLGAPAASVPAGGRDSRATIGTKVAETPGAGRAVRDAASRYPDQLSGGERQRVAVARALAAEPSLLVCDEITSALDVSVQAAIVELLRDLREQTGLSMLFITHNLALIRTIADKVIVMTEGKIVEYGDTLDVFERPQAEYTKRLLANTPTVENALGGDSRPAGEAGARPPRPVNTEAFITCAITGAGDTTARSDLVPVTPEQIAESAIGAARAGAAVVHIHVRDPETRQGSRDVSLYRRAVEIDPRRRRRRRDQPDRRDGRRPRARRPAVAAAAGRRRHRHGRRDRASGARRGAAAGDLHARLRHDELRRRRRLRDDQHAGMLRTMAAEIRALGVRPELEVFDYGQLVMVHDLLAEGLIDDPVLIQLCMGIRYGAPDDPQTLIGLVDKLPRAPCSRRSRSGGCSCRTWRWRCSPAATSASD